MAAPPDACSPWPAGNSVRAAVKEANPEAEASDMLKLLAQAWKDLSEEEQLKWKGEAEADKARYFAECKEAGVEPELKEGKDEADKHPKKPKGAYFCYAMSQRATVQEVRRSAAAPAPPHPTPRHPSTPPPPAPLEHARRPARSPPCTRTVKCTRRPMHVLTAPICS